MSRPATLLRISTLSAFFAAGFLSSVPAAEFAPVFTNSAVLQRDQPVAIWGTGRDGEKVTVELLDKSASAVVASGRWSVTLPASPATASTTLRLRGDNTRELTDIAIGEIWLGLGQSNMEWRLNQCPPFTDALLASADNPAIRQLKIPLRPYAGDPMQPFAWKKLDRSSAPYFAAVTYFFAAELQKKLGVTVGIVNCSFGGTPIEAWMSREALASAGMNSLLADHDRKLAVWPDFAAFDKAWRDYDVARKAYEERKKANPSDPALGAQPVEPYGVRTKGRPAGLRDSMLALVTPYTARGALWYQGENNAGKPDDYLRMLPVFMAELRSSWGRPDLPVYIGQLSSPTSNWPDEKEGYAPLREVQRAIALADPHSGFVVTLDHGERGNVHPKNKQPVGERFARLALARVYGETGYAAQSPSAATATLTTTHVSVSFRDLPGRLELRDPALPTLELLANGTWKPASATLSPDGKSLLVSVPDSSTPKSVRYAYRNFCALTLFSDDGLPVSPWIIPVTASKP
jgi:sialate O-acetylesterase